MTPLDVAFAVWVAVVVFNLVAFGIKELLQFLYWRRVGKQ